MAKHLLELESKLHQWANTHQLKSVLFTRVPVDYFDRDLHGRANLLGASTIMHLCKTLIFKNSRYEDSYSSEPYYTKYSAAVIQYPLNVKSERMMKHLKELQNKNAVSQVVSKKHWHLRMAEREEAESLTGVEVNAMSPVFLEKNVPVFVNSSILKMDPPFVWLGGGDLYLKVGIHTQELVKFTNAHIIDLTS